MSKIEKTVTWDVQSKHRELGSMWARLNNCYSSELFAQQAVERMGKDFPRFEFRAVRVVETVEPVPAQEVNQ